MTLDKIVKNHSATRQRVKMRRKRKLNKRKPSRSSTIDSKDSIGLKISDCHGEHDAKTDMNHLSGGKTGDWKLSDVSEVQVIPFQHIDEWALFILLEAKFGANKYKIEASKNSLREEVRELTLCQQTYEAFNVWAPGELRKEDVESCRL